MASVVEEQKRCTYCFQELNEMTDPRQLPCTHIVCLPCLNNDWKLDQLECRVCSVKANVKELSTLPKVVHITEEKSSNVGPDTRTSTCDVCKTEEHAAVYCEDCGKKLCTRHKESHRDFFDDAHRMVTITKYNGQPNRFKKAVCKHHPTNFIQHVCNLCYRMPCSYCTPGPCDKPGKDHHFQTLDQARSDIQAEMENRLTETSKKIAELCNLEKQTWVAGDELTEKCEAMLKQVDTTMEQQISDIQKQASQLREHIQRYKSDQLLTMEEYIANLMSKVESLEATQVSTSRLLKENNITEIIEHRSEMIDALDQVNTLDSSTPHNVGEKILTSNAQLQFCLQMVPKRKKVFNHMNYRTQLLLSKGNKCRSLLFNDTGELIFACSAQLLIGNPSNFEWREPKDMAINSDIYSVGQPPNIYAGAICALSKEGVIYLITPKGTSHSASKLFSIDNSSNIQPKMCASDRYVVTSKAQNRLVIYNTQSGKKYENQLPENDASIRSICFDTDGDLLVLDTTNSCLNKYRIDEFSTLKLIWSCALPTGAYAACVDRSGQRRELVFVTGAQRILSIIENGNIVQTLKNESLPDHDLSTGEFSDISVHGNTLATTQNRTRSFSIFDLVY